MSDNHLFEELPFGGICPDCESPVEFYNTAEDKKGGRYKCTKCPRDTVWKHLKALTIDDVLKKMGVAKPGE